MLRRMFLCSPLALLGVRGKEADIHNWNKRALAAEKKLEERDESIEVALSCLFRRCYAGEEADVDGAWKELCRARDDYLYNS